MNLTTEITTTTTTLGPLSMFAKAPLGVPVCKQGH